MSFLIDLRVSLLIEKTNKAGSVIYIDMINGLAVSEY